MDKCRVCGGNITQEEPLYLYFSERDDVDVYACAKCEKQMNIIMESQEPSDVKKAINYFYTFIDETNDSEVRRFLKDVIANNVSMVEDLELKKEKQKPITERQKDYFSDRKEIESNHSASGWIAGCKVLAWIAFLAIVIAGISIASPFFSRDIGIGIGIVALSFVVAFSSLGVLMVFLDMASDIKMLRNSYEKK